jgi:hypothetical protein
MFGNLEASFNSLVGNVGIVGTIQAMVIPDGTHDTDYSVIKTEFGFPDDATARAAFDEIQAVKGKLNSDASVTFVNAAIAQAINKFR